MLVGVLSDVRFLEGAQPLPFQLQSVGDVGVPTPRLIARMGWWFRPWSGV